MSPNVSRIPSSHFHRFQTRTSRSLGSRGLTPCPLARTWRCYRLLWEERGIARVISGAIFTAAGTRRVQSQMRNCWELTSGTEQLPSNASPPIPFSAGPIAGESPPSFRSHTMSDNQPTQETTEKSEGAATGVRFTPPSTPTACNQCPFFFTHFRATLPCTLTRTIVSATRTVPAKSRLASMHSIFAEVITDIILL